MNWEQMNKSTIVTGKKGINNVRIIDFVTPRCYRTECGKYGIDFLIARESFSSRALNQKGKKNLLNMLSFRECHGHLPNEMQLKFVHYTALHTCVLRLKSRKKVRRYEKIVCYWIPLIYESLISHFMRKESGDIILN